jgi:hypothetical protein
MPNPKPDHCICVRYERPKCVYIFLGGHYIAQDVRSVSDLHQFLFCEGEIHI